MRKKIFKVLLIAVSFFLFKDGVYADQYYELTEYSNSPVTCNYYNSSTNKKIKLVYDNNDKVSVYIGGVLMPDALKVEFEIITKGSNCPDTIVLDGTGIFKGPSSGEESSSNKQTSKNKVYCGREEEGRITGIPKKIPQLTSMIVTIIQIAIPIILVLFGSIDLFKGITAGKEDEIKKGQQMFIKRLIVGALIFFVVVIVKFLISVIAETNKDNIADCIDCFISNDCEEM